MIKKFIPVFSYVIISGLWCQAARAASPDEIFTPLLKQKTFLYDSGFNYFLLKEDGKHGGATYDKFYSTPYFYSFDNSIRCPVLPSVDVTLGFNESPSATYHRTTYSPSGAINSEQKYTLDYQQDYRVNVKARQGPAEFYLDVLKRREESKWSWHVYPKDVPNYYAYIASHYEDLALGMKYLSPDYTAGDASSLSVITRPLMDSRQFYVESSWEYRSGELKRNNPYYAYNIYYNFYHKLKPVNTPKALFRYGLTDKVEVEAGLAYTFPFEYEYDYIVYYMSGNTSLKTSGTYTLDNNFSVPVALRARPVRNLELGMSSDLSFAHQSLDSSTKNTNDSLRVNASRSLDFFGIRPAAQLTYLYDAGKDTPRDDFSSVTKRLLMKNQCLLELRYLRDIVALRKNSDNGPLNLIDPYNIFLYPVDYFTAGTEYSTFFVGDVSTYAADVKAQNYNIFGIRVSYGITDAVNVGFGCGYRSGSAFHHLSMYDMQTRAYKIKGYCYIDPSADVRLTRNSMLSFTMHYVPQYVTFMQNTGYPKEFKSETTYLDLSANIRILF
ncbi:MAG: hypothetical protein PHS37_02170 [Candidatus Omnitrophica bacterium]|nr:hypothetical protein [Candidatus Omnitrophota bacterium]